MSEGQSRPVINSIDQNVVARFQAKRVNVAP